MSMKTPKTFRAYVNTFRGTPCWKEKIAMCIRVIKDEKVDKELRKKAEDDLMTIGSTLNRSVKEWGEEQERREYWRQYLKNHCAGAGVSL